MGSLSFNLCREVTLRDEDEGKCWNVGWSGPGPSAHLVQQVLIRNFLHPGIKDLNIHSTDLEPGFP